MAFFTWDSFIGGEQASSKRGYRYGYQDGLGLDYRGDAEKLTALRKLSKESSSTVVDLIKWFKEYNGYVFGYGDTGKLYRRSTDATPVWSVQRTVSGGAGQGLEIFNTLNADALWYPQSTQLGRATTLTGTMVFDDDYIDTIDQNIDINESTGTYGNTYSVPTSITENATNQQDFVPAKIMLEDIEINVGTKGTTANWTVTVHDDANVVIGTATLANANVTGSAYNRFVFSTPLELVPGATYHFHVTVSNTTGTPTVNTTTSADLNTVGWRSIYPVLVADTLYHPCKEFTNLLCIGNSRFLAILDDSEVYDPERLIFPKGEAVRCLEVVGDYLAIITWRYSDITKVKESKMYLWDGVSPTYRNIIPITGQVNAITNHDNVLYMINGTLGQLSAWKGSVTPIRKLNDVGPNKTVEVYPGAIWTWDNLIHFGISAGTSVTCPRPVYTYGTQNKDYPLSLSKAFPTSSDSIADIANKVDNNDVQVGAGIGTDSSTLLVSWKNGSTYGVDKLITTKDQNSVYVTTMRYDADKSFLLKQLTKIIITHSPLAAEDSFSVDIRLNNAGSFEKAFVSDGDQSPGAISRTYVPPTPLEFLEIEFRIWINGAEDLPDFYALTMEFEELDAIRTDPIIVDSL